MNLGIMSTKERATVIDTIVKVRVERELTIECAVLDVRPRFGTWDLKLTPVSGSGKQWVNEERCVA